LTCGVWVKLDGRQPGLTVGFTGHCEVGMCMVTSIVLAGIDLCQEGSAPRIQPLTSLLPRSNGPASGSVFCQCTLNPSDRYGRSTLCLYQWKWWIDPTSLSAVACDGHSSVLEARSNDSFTASEARKMCRLRPSKLETQNLDVRYDVCKVRRPRAVPIVVSQAPVYRP
jgi:hypothetical protein